MENLTDHDLRQIRRLARSLLWLLASRGFRDLPPAEQDRRIDAIADLRMRRKTAAIVRGRLE
jgi:hypothetical protein